MTEEYSKLWNAQTGDFSTITTTFWWTVFVQLWNLCYYYEICPLLRILNDGPEYRGKMFTVFCNSLFCNVQKFCKASKPFIIKRRHPHRFKLTRVTVGITRTTTNQKEDEVLHNDRCCSFDDSCCIWQVRCTVQGLRCCYSLCINHSFVRALIHEDNTTYFV